MDAQKQESGENPNDAVTVYGSCFQKPLGSTGKGEGDDQSQENCLDVQFQTAVHSACIPHNETMLFL